MQILCASYHSFPITMDKAKYKDSHCLDGIASGLFVCNRGDTEQYVKRTNHGALIHLDGGQYYIVSRGSSDQGC